MKTDTAQLVSIDIVTWTSFHYIFVLFFLWQYIEAPDVEEEVKRLLRMDSTAIKIRILSLHFIWVWSQRLSERLT